MSAPHMEAVGDLLRRYGSVLRVAWSGRHQDKIPEREAFEAAFLPAHLELMETPLHPAPRWTMRIIVALVFSALLIAVLGKLDIVVTANGELIPDTNVKVVQPAITGVVRAILVHDGEQVGAGQPLIALDTQQAAADAATARDRRIHSALAMARAQALLLAAKTGKPPHVSPVLDASDQEQRQAGDLTEQTWRAYEDKRLDARAQLAARVADLATTNHEIAKLEATAPLAKQQAEAYDALLKTKDVTQMDYLDREKTAQDLIHELAAQQSHASQLRAMIAQQKASLAEVTSEFLRDERLDLDKSTLDFAASQNEETKASTREKLLTLTAPVAGTVQQLSVHTLGGVVTTAQALLKIVPSDSLKAKVVIENRDVGFVQEGQPVVIKVAAFPYTRYGYLHGQVEELSNDASDDKKHGLVFVAYIRLNSDRMKIGSRWITMTPGMSVTADVTTGKRRVISYFLGPLIQNTQESLHER